MPMRRFVSAFVLAAALSLSRAADKKLTVGFSQIGAESGWRSAETESIQSEAARRGIELKYSDAQQKQENQIKALRAFVKAEGKTINAVYAHNDDMALGAIQAIEEAGLQPGKDVMVVSIDGIKPAFEAMVNGKLNCTVECNPLLGPAAFDAVQAAVAG